MMSSPSSIFPSTRGSGCPGVPRRAISCPANSSDAQERVRKAAGVTPRRSLKTRMKWDESQKPVSVATSVTERPECFSRYSAYRSEEHTSELQSLMRTSYAVVCLNNKHTHIHTTHNTAQHLA